MLHRNSSMNVETITKRHVHDRWMASEGFWEALGPPKVVISLSTSLKKWLYKQRGFKSLPRGLFDCSETAVELPRDLKRFPEDLPECSTSPDFCFLLAFEHPEQPTWRLDPVQELQWHGFGMISQRFWTTFASLCTKIWKRFSDSLFTFTRSYLLAHATQPSYVSTLQVTASRIPVRLLLHGGNLWVSF